MTGTPYGAAARTRGADDRPQQPRLGGHGRATAAARDLRRRTAEVEVDVIDEAFVAHEVDRPSEGVGIGPVDLQAAWPLGRSERHHPAGLVVAVDDRGRHDHLVDVDEVGGVGPAHGAERGVGDAGHRCQHDRRRRRERSDPQRQHLDHGTGRPVPGVTA